MANRNDEFNKAAFQHRAEEEGQWSEAVFETHPALEHYMYGNSSTVGTHRWPSEYLKQVTDKEHPTYDEHRQVIENVLNDAGLKGPTITVRRTGAPKAGITNVSLIPGWKSWKAFQQNPPEKTYEWEVPREDVVALGHPSEGEVFVRHPADRPIREV